MLAEYLGNAEAWSFLDMDVIQPGETLSLCFVAERPRCYQSVPRLLLWLVSGDLQLRLRRWVKWSGSGPPDAPWCVATLAQPHVTS